ncbi:MAG: hypothetical protein LBU11_00215 [Zoogloeaceae bacterium]|jgi:hypothetical protein|nr:hypothetical protein [Zoogloeaceae bacterium]
MKIFPPFLLFLLASILPLQAGGQAMNEEAVNRKVISAYAEHYGCADRLDAEKMDGLIVLDFRKVESLSSNIPFVPAQGHERILVHETPDYREASMSFPRFLITALFFLVMSGIVMAAPSDATALEEEMEALTREANAFIEQEANAYLDCLMRSCLPEDVSPRKSYDRAIAAYDEIERRHGQDAREAIRLRVLAALGNKARALLLLTEWEAEGALWEDIWRRFGQARNPEIRARLAQVLSWRVSLLFRYGSSTAIATADRMLAHFGKDETPAVRRALAAALYYKGAAIVRRSQSGWHKEAPTVFREVDARFGQDKDPETRYWVVRALRENVPADKHMRAMLYREIDRRFGGGEELPQTRALVIQGFLDHLSYGGTWEDDIYAEIERRFGKDKDPAIRVMLAKAILRRVWHSDDPAEQIAASDEILRRFGDDTDTMLREQVLRALAQKAEAQTQDAAILAIYDEILRRYREDESEEIGELLAGTRKKRGALRIRLGQVDSAEVVLADIEKTADDKKSRERLAETLRTSALALLEQGKPAEAVAIYQAMKTRMDTGNVMAEDQAFALKIALVRTLGNASAILIAQGAKKKEAALWAELDARFGKEDRYVKELVLEALCFEGAFLAGMRPDDPGLALAAFRQVIERAGSGKRDYYVESAIEAAREAIDILSSPDWPKNRRELLDSYFND